MMKVSSFYLLVSVAFLFAAQGVKAASELEIVNWLRPLMGPHSLHGANGCERITIDNVTSQWDRFAVIHFAVGPAGDFIYSPSYQSDRNCSLRPLNQGSSILDCSYANRSGPLGQNLERWRVQLVKAETNVLSGFRFLRTTTPNPAGNWSASCN